MSRIQLEIEERVLSNGLTAVAIKNPGVSTCAVTVSLKVGQLDEGSNEHGLAYLMGACLDEGSKKRTSLELDQAVENIGGSLECGVTGGTILCPAEERSKAVRLLREAVLEPVFPGREVRRVQSESLAEIEAELADPRMCGQREFRRQVYGSHPYARPSFGSAEQLAAYKPSDLVRFHKKWFVPQEGFVAISGPGEVGESLDLLAKAFRSFKGKAPVHPVPTAPEMPKKSVSTHLPMEREQVHVFLGHPGVRRNNPDFYALSVMDHILGSGPGFTSRITRKLRDDMGLCYTVHAAATSGAGLEPGIVSAYIGTSPEHRQKAIDGFIKEIKTIRDTLPTEDELADVKAYLTGSFVFGLERNSNLVGYAIRAKRYGLGYGYIHEFPGLIKAITLEDVQAAAQKHLDPARLVTVSAGAS